MIERRRRTRIFPLIAGLVAAMTATSPAAAAPPDIDEARQQAEWAMGRMSLEEKVGQLFVTYAYGSTADAVDSRNRQAYGVDTPAQVVQRYHLGGVIYFAWSGNLQNPRQIAELSNGLQRAATGSGSRIPLVISTDQEHGVVTRVGPPAAQFPGSMALGAGAVGSGSDRDAHDAAAIGGRELRAVGINTDYAPVADVNVNPDNPVIGVRSFSADPGLAAELTAAQVRGYQRSGPPWRAVSAAAKHFPGHGDTAVDSHFGFPVITHTREEWNRLDAPPFREAIDAGIDSIMTAHIAMPHLDASQDPATLSRPILTGLLRDELGFDGVVVTDSLAMQGVRDKYGDDRVPVLALQAGADMLLMPPDLGLAYDSVLEAVRGGELTERRIDESVRRILIMKLRRGVLTHPLVDPAAVDQRVGTPQHLESAQRITDRTITALRDDTDLLPLPPAAGRGVLVTGWGASTVQALAAGFTARGATATVRVTGSAPSDAAIAAAAADAHGKDLVVVLVNSTPTGTQTTPGNRARQRLLVEALMSSGTDVVAVAVRDPYDAAHVAGATAWLCTFSYTAVSMESVVRVLQGEVRSAGRLPMAIPTADGSATLYPFGHGIDL